MYKGKCTFIHYSKSNQTVPKIYLIFNNTKNQAEAAVYSGALRFNLFYFHEFLHAVSSTKFHGRLLEVE